MSNFKQGGDRNRGGFRKPFNGGNFGKRPNFNRDNRGGRPTEMFNAVCTQCGEQCEVPFRPSGGKPVLCNNCFGRKDGSAGFSGPREHSGFKKEFGRSNDRAERIERGNLQSDEIKNQLIALNLKLEKIIALMQPTKPAQPIISPIVVTKEVLKKEKKPKKVAPAKKVKKTTKK